MNHKEIYWNLSSYIGLTKSFSVGAKRSHFGIQMWKVIHVWERSHRSQIHACWLDIKSCREKYFCYFGFVFFQLFWWYVHDFISSFHLHEKSDLWRLAVRVIAWKQSRIQICSSQNWSGIFQTPLLFSLCLKAVRLFCWLQMRWMFFLDPYPSLIEQEW